MTPSMNQQNGAVGGAMNRMRYRGGQQPQPGAPEQNMSMRQDGSNVPGNQPGGENGSFGQFGQDPQAQPPSTPPAGPPTYGGGAMGGGAMQPGMMNRYRGPQAGPSSNMMPPQQPDGMQPSAQGQAPPAPTPTAGAASSPSMMDDSTPQMASGGVVSKPTVAMLGDKGPEAVIPLTNPDPKLSPGMFTKSRYRRPTGPSGVHGPSRPLLPLSPSKLMR
jgi:hypothetical protein